MNKDGFPVFILCTFGSMERSYKIKELIKQVIKRTKTILLLCCIGGNKSDYDS